jgi:hypothetical protein
MGNSGGALMVRIDGQWFLTGVAAQIDIVGHYPLTYLSYFVPPEWIQEFLTQNA